MSLRVFPILNSTPASRLRVFPAAACGWPSPALEYEEPPLSLDELVGVDATATCLVWVTDDALAPSGICRDDVLVADMAIQPQPGDIVLALVDGEHYLRRLSARDQAPALIAELPGISPLMIGDEQTVEITAVVTWNLHRQPGAYTPTSTAPPERLDEIVKMNECSTFLVRARGESMLGAGIRPGDVLVVDRDCVPRLGHIVIAIVGGEFTVKRLGTDLGQLALLSENPYFSAIPLHANDDPALWGVVTWCLQKRIRR